MFVHDRHQAILNHLRQKPRWSVEALLRKLPVSRSTLRRDLVDLERNRAVLRVHGGVVRPDYLQGEPTFDRRQREHDREKCAIAAAAAVLIPDKSTVYLDAGTTALRVAELLFPRTSLRLFTHSLRIMNLVGNDHAPITCVGGEYRCVSDALVGGMTLAWLDNLHFDVAVVGASGLAENGASTTELSECAVKQRIIQRAAQTILVCDASKWNTPAAVRFAGWNDFSTWVTDASLPANARPRFRHGGMRLLVTPRAKGVKL